MDEIKYSIVRVQEKCPSGWNLEPSFCATFHGGTCEKCKINNNYGDTKEQMIKKVAQILFQEELEYWKNRLTFEEGHYKMIYRKSLETAKKVVEFLGVDKGVDK